MQNILDLAKHGWCTPYPAEILIDIIIVARLSKTKMITRPRNQRQPPGGFFSETSESI
jgi:hypothetical protein